MVGLPYGLLIHSVIAAPSVTEKIYYYHNDHLGTPQVLTDGNGQVVWKGDYRPFGEVDIVVEEVRNDFRFPGQYYDQETGLHYNYHRYYHFNIGRYLRADPATEMYGFSEREHPYVYTMNNPIALTDPLALAATCTFIYSSRGFVPGKGYQGTLNCVFDNKSRDPKCCKTFSETAYTGRGDKRRFTSDPDGPIPQGTWYIGNIGSQAHRPGQAWLLPRKGVKRYPGRNYNDFLIHALGRLGSYGCIAVIAGKYPDLRHCLENEANTGPEPYTCGTLEVKIQ